MTVQEMSDLARSLGSDSDSDSPGRLEIDEREEEQSAREHQSSGDTPEVSDQEQQEQEQASVDEYENPIPSTSGGRRVPPTATEKVVNINNSTNSRN